MKKSDLLSLMHKSGFDWICDVACINGHELVASKMNDSDQLWWRSVEIEGSGFTKLFKGSIRAIENKRGETGRLALTTASKLTLWP